MLEGGRVYIGANQALGAFLFFFGLIKEPRASGISALGTAYYVLLITRRLDV